jgi:hypothetical protein
MGRKKVKKLRISARKDQVEAGFFDGRFVTRRIKNKKKEILKLFCRKNKNNEESE